MAEEPVSYDKHRADLLELRGELKEEIAGIRQDVAVLSKNVEHLAQTMQAGFNDMRREMDLRHQELIRDMGIMRQDIRGLHTAVQRQMWALIAVVAGGAIKMLFFS